MSAAFAAALEAVCFPSRQARKPGLTRTRRLLEELGNPQKGLRFVHIAGTNGKGSTAAMLASVLTAAGYRTGLYTSPHLVRYGERFRVDGAEIPEEALLSLLEEARPALSALGEQPSEFELLTALACLYFRRRECEIVVWEVGLGGRLDPTNVIDAPECAVITGIGLEHTEFLGDTVEKIAAEKAGIIKPGSPVICQSQSQEAEAVIRKRSAELGCRLTVTAPALLTPGAADLDGQTFSYRTRRSLRLGLLGPFQLRNAAAALDAVDALRRQGWAIPEDAVRRGLADARWPGRFEALRKDPAVIVDGAHNPHGVEALAECLERYFPRGSVTFVMGVMADKDYRAMAARIAPYARGFVTVTPDSARALTAEALAADIRDHLGLPAAAEPSVEDGVRRALRERGPEGAVCVFGSLYQAGRVRTLLGR